MAGGQGSRLRPLTLTRPKPMVEVLGRPVIDFVKDAMVEAGIDDLIVTTGYRGEQLQKHVSAWPLQSMKTHSREITARINQEDSPMGTAGSVRLLSDLLTETFVVGSGDSVASFDISGLLAAHKQSGAKVTMALWEVEDPSDFGIVGLSSEHNGELDGDLREGYISRFKEKPSPEEAFSNVINAGLYIIEPEVLALMPLGEKFDFSKQLFPMVLEMNWPMYAKTIDGVWFDVGNPMELLNAQSTLVKRMKELPFPMPNGTVLPGNGFCMDDAVILGDVVSSVISSNCFVEENVKISNSLLMSGCKISPDSIISNSVLGQNVVIGNGAK
ncbi:MAG: NTP transferase domain-containing protein, partial [Euryarchaeota archaeon]|nr:NTP transferase domain-containing protein [Euryarchaeota archaeon]